MLEAKIIMAIISASAFFIANKIHYGFNGGLRTLSNTIFDGIGIASGIAFLGLMLCNQITLHTVPRSLLFISICIYIRYKKKKKFCTPAWKIFHITAITYCVLGVAGTILDVIGITLLSQLDKQQVASLVALYIILVGILLPSTHIFFTVYPGRFKKSSYYY